MRAGNKLTMRHLRFSDCKMNVSLAVQVLSHSTGGTLEYIAQEDNNNGFKDAHGTANFCKNFNDAFDILNCRHKFAHDNEFGCPINAANYERLRNRSLEIIEYIEALKNHKGQLIVNSTQKCGYVEIIASLTNIFVVRRP